MTAGQADMFVFEKLDVMVEAGEMFAGKPMARVYFISMCDSVTAIDRYASSSLAIA